MKNRVIIIMMISMCLALSGASHANSSTQHISYPDLFDEVVKIVEDNFYNPAQISRDFKVIQENYRK